MDDLVAFIESNRGPLKFDHCHGSTGGQHKVIEVSIGGHERVDVVVKGQSQMKRVARRERIHI